MSQSYIQRLPTQHNAQPIVAGSDAMAMAIKLIRIIRRITHMCFQDYVFFQLTRIEILQKRRRAPIPRAQNLSETSSARLKVARVATTHIVCSKQMSIKYIQQSQQLPQCR